MAPEIIRTDRAPTPGNYNQAFKVDVGLSYLLYTAGQTGNLPSIEDIDEPVVEGGIGPQTTQTLKNIEAVLAAAGGTLQHVIKTTVFLEDFADKAGFEEAYTGYFSEKGVSKDILPARSTVEARVPLATENTLVEIEAVAYIPKQ
jgi:2-iminobutanoate/2-iminopropanoate deaminase